MNTAIWRNLLWKEWREQRWKLVALVAVVVGLHVWALDATEPGYGHYADPLIMSHSIVLPIGSILLAVGLAAGERSHRTAPFLRSLPLDLRKVAAVKLAMTLAVSLIAQAVAVLLTVGLLSLVESSGWQQHGTSEALNSYRSAIEMGHWAPSCLVLSILLSSSLILWIAAPAVNSESEVRAGAIGLVVIVALWTAFSGLLYWTARGVEELAPVVAALPGGIRPDLGISRVERGYLLGAFLLTHVPLAWWYISRFGQASDPVGLSPRDASKATTATIEWLGPPMRSPIYALGWKQLRQGVPVALAGAACAVAVTIVVLSNSNPGSGGLTEREQLLYSWGYAAEISFMILGVCAGLVGGAGAVTTELEPRLFTFWRSRPVSPDLWFWTTFLSGLALQLIVFGVPVLFAAKVLVGLSGSQHSGVYLPILAASYVAGAFTAAIVRHAVYASFIGIGVFSAVVALPHVEWFSLPEPFHGPAILVASAMLAALAWLAVRNDWSLRVG